MKEQETKTRFAINPPPSDGCCEICGKHKEELKPYREEDNPYNPEMVKVEGSKLIKNFRGFPPSEPDPWVSKSWECRDCIRLDKKEAWEIFKKTHKRGDEKSAD